MKEGRKIGNRRKRPRLNVQAGAEEGHPAKSTQSVTRYELLADFHLNFWTQAAEQFFSTVRSIAANSVTNLSRVFFFS